jgi:anti-anti-sigma factor
MSEVEMESRESSRGLAKSFHGAAPMTTPHSIGFGLAVTYDADSTTVAVHGDVDLLTAPSLQAAMVALADQGRLNIILDLGALTFMDASGLSVIADMCDRLLDSTHVLTILSSPPMTRHILDITHLSERVRLRSSEPRVASEDLAGLRVGLRANDEVIDASLRRVTELVGATMQGADGVSITLERDGRLSTVAASNSTVMEMDGHQYETGQGPCLSAAAEGCGFHIQSLANETRWPAFVPLALEQGIASILSTPLKTVERSLGALNIYSNSERVFGPQQQELAALFASHASALLADPVPSDAQMNERLADALESRRTIARAQGVLMARERITANDAAAAIHRSARTACVTVARQAETIVASTQSDAAIET